MNVNQKLEKFAVREYRRNAHHIIVETDYDQHLVFGTYVLNQTGQGVEVRNRAEDIVGIFGSRRSALSYCVADKYKNYELSRQIRLLDEKKQILDADIQTHRAQVIQSQNAEFRDLVSNKLSQRIAQQSAVKVHLEKCINQAKYLQIRGFQNETARVFTH